MRLDCAVLILVLCLHVSFALRNSTQLSREGKASSRSCGRRGRRGRIVGGGTASIAEWPWQVSLRQYSRGRAKHKCGAALVSRSWIITAAHCVKGLKPRNLVVRLGEYNSRSSRDGRTVDKRVKKIVLHSRFNRRSYANDIAMLKVSPVSYSATSLPVCLPSSSSSLVGRSAVVTGWGRTSERSRPASVLREVSVPILSNKQCERMYRASGQKEYIPYSQFLCAGQTGRDSCDGDSGGPLVVRDRDGRYSLAGLISWGIGCGKRNRPGVYTRISEYRTWIRNVLRSG